MQSFCEFLNNNCDFLLDKKDKKEFLFEENSLKEIIKKIKEEKILTEKELLNSLAQYFEIDLYSNLDLDLKKINSDKLTLSQVEEFKIIFLAENKNYLLFGSLYPPDLFLQEKLKYRFKKKIKFYLMTEAEFNELKKNIYNSYFKIDQNEILKEIGDFKKIDSRNIENLKNIVEDAPVVKLLNKLIVEAISLNASDIHLEKKEDYFKIRYRIDGILTTHYKLPAEISAAVISRIKIISGMDITVRFLPQDGQIEFENSDSIYDIRTSVIPTIYGEKAVLRLLLRNDKLLSLAELNFDQLNLMKIKKILNFNSGIVLLSGPTGSGKTTTLFSILKELADEKNNIITVENPVEYKLELLNQIEINKAQGLNFAEILRSILRQDPDIIMIGEIRDKETAEIAVRAAATGHLVFSTIHTIDSISAVSRLIDIGIAPYLISSTLKAVVAQRLIRKLCPECKIKKELKIEEKTLIKNKNIKYLYYPQGCENCNNGYSGRTSVSEVLLINDKLKTMITKKLNYNQLKKEAVNSGMIDLYDSAEKKIKKGISSLEEMLRVVDFK